VKILVVHSELGVLRGGGENFTRNLFSAFASRGHTVAATFIAGSRGDYPITLPAQIAPLPLAGYWSRKLGQDVLSRVGGCIPKSTSFRTTWDRFQEALCWRTVRWHDQRFARRVDLEFNGRWKDFDAVYVHGNSVLAGHIAKVCPTVLRLPGPVSEELAPLLKGIHAVCANGDALRHIRAFLGDHATELPIGLDTDLFKPGSSQERQQLGWTNEEWVIGYVGRLAYVKGIDLLTEAFKKLRTSIPHARLLVIGTGEEEGKLRAGLKEELAGRLVHMEADVPHERLADWYRAMDLFVMPSRYENHSNAVLEALACGVPFLGSNVGGNPRLVETQGGALFAADSVESLTETLRSLAENTNGVERSMAFHQGRLRSAIGWDASAKRLEEIFQECLRKSLERDSDCGCREC
jgi:glycosyltransferase involved in cell wall biosynthesis